MTPDFASLTTREREVLELMAAGWTNEEIAGRLTVGVRTVESHAWSVFLKLGVTFDPRVNRRVRAAALWLAYSDATVAVAA